MLTTSRIRSLWAGWPRFRGSRWAVVLAGAVGLIAAAAPSTAAALDGRELNIGVSSLTRNEPHKSAVARCSSPRKRVVGGGAAIQDGNRKQVRLVQLLPLTYGGLFQDSFVVIAEAPNLDSPYDWSVTAYAICVDAEAAPGHRIISNYVEVPSTGGPFQQTTARCPRGMVAYGSGSRLIATGDSTGSLAAGQIGLQLNRISESQDSSRSTAREQAGGSPLPWRLYSYAICAEPPEEMVIRRAIETDKDETSASCDTGWDVIGPGGGGGLTDGGPVWLRNIIPSNQSVTVGMTGLLYPSSGGMVVQMSCAR